ncbi:MAG: ABC transporter ATP-binding protein/permease [Clostridia bacterium]|nr:ABC transporter ATP-binding protein/permease [Clostridia bacterium]
MLKLVDVKKEYYAGGETVQALKGVSINFRRNEFVSILGASGCGKTTLLNIIGGLDKYNSGDLIIDGVSTKEYGDRDWDTYRNHSIGFIFQSYHLIPHQTILQNVELALMIAGVSKEERRRRAIEALEKVGLKDKLNNRPNQLSGGQAQRVAIARALINDPEIVLADEPTGALDSKTSVQIMELLKEISNDRLVIMVTHNPELAEQYSTRIIRLLDGQVTDDTKPYADAEEAEEVKASAEAKAAAKKAEEEEELKRLEEEAAEGGKVKRKKSKREKKKASMPITMAFGLSLKNLLSKRKRTAMVSIAGSIGIIGVSMVLAISAGVKGYIKDMEDDMLSGYPITITRSTFDWAAITNINDTLSKKVEITKLKDKVYVDSLLQTMMDMGNNFMTQNEISENYINYVSQMPSEYYNAMQFSYDFEAANYLYTDFHMVGKTSDTKIPENVDSSSDSMSLTAIRAMYRSILGEEPSYSMYTSMLDQFTGLNEIPDNADYVLSQYDVVATNGDLTENQVREALNSKDSLILVLDDGKTDELNLAQYGFLSQEELLNYAFKASSKPEDQAKYDPEIGLVGSGIKGEDPYYNDELGGGGFDYSFFFNKTFKFYPNNAIYSKLPAPIVTNIGGEDKSINFLYNAYGENLPDEGSFDLGVKVILQKKSDISYGCLADGLYYTNALTKHIIEQGLNSEIAEFIKANGNLDVVGYTYNYSFFKTVDGVRNYEKKTTYGFFTDSSGGMMAMNGPSYAVTLGMVAGSDLATGIGIFPLDFNMKDKITDYLDEWNNMCDAEAEYGGVKLTERDKVKYSDMVGVIISMINTMIEMITIALVAFTALSLIVSTVMVGIITYVSVVERIKEIGILRSVGARKKDIKRLFNAETFIIGLIAGLFGIIVTYILSLIINLVVASLAPITTIAALPWWQAFIMVCISVVLTLISGLIPAAAAAKKDPVVALRTE